MSNAHECTFGERLEKLMVEDGIDIAKKKGADTELHLECWLVDVLASM